ncbi:MAG TPA: DUF2339 domain-containing protein, partial [Planctomycetaceae bacterium]|nr:DUF2339 domain-containing protein [Planctomycetaceae bacterium]
ILTFWKLNEAYCYVGPYSPLDGVVRLLDFGVIAACCFAAAALIRRAAPEKESANQATWYLAAVGLILLFVYLTLEANTILTRFVPGLRPGGISILWSLFALATILYGIVKNIRVLRYAGLCLFAVVAWKVFFVDLRGLDQLYRIVAFLVLGVLVLGGSFLYMRFRETFTVEGDKSGSRRATEDGSSEERRSTADDSPR